MVVDPESKELNMFLFPRKGTLPNASGMKLQNVYNKILYILLLGTICTLYCICCSRQVSVITEYCTELTVRSICELTFQRRTHGSTTV